MRNDFNYSDEKFADIQMLRYRLNGFESLTARQRVYIYYLSKATLAGRDITTDQFGKYNIRIRKMLEAVYKHYTGDRKSHDFRAMEEYLKRVWFSNGIYHHYGCEKFQPQFSRQFLADALEDVPASELPLHDGKSVEAFRVEIFNVIFNPEVLPKRVNKKAGDDLVTTSACNFYDGVTQQEVEAFYKKIKDNWKGGNPPSFGLNSRLVKKDGVIEEEIYSVSGLYAEPIKQIVFWLSKAKNYAENERQQRLITLLIDYYTIGDIRTFDEYSIEWLKEQKGTVDFINGFIEVYGDPLGMKGSWEGLVEYVDAEATRRTRLISQNAQWFEDHSPIDDAFKKREVTGVSARVICAAMLGGDEYPASAIGINLPNSEWIRAEYGSKSVTIGNLTEAYNMAARGNGFYEEFVIPDGATLDNIIRYGDVCDDLHTDLHECLGHGSGRLLEGVDQDALKEYGSVIEEARADLFGLYYIADEKLVELGLTPNMEAYCSQYYTYMMNGLLTQMVRITPGNDIEEAHMQNRALIAHWALDAKDGSVELTSIGGKTFVKINDYAGLRRLFARQLREIQRIKSEGDYESARKLVEKYAIKTDKTLHGEVLSRYQKLGIAPYKGFINPRMAPITDSDGNIVDVEVDYSESYEHQMMRYSEEYGLL